METLAGIAWGAVRGDGERVPSSAWCSERCRGITMEYKRIQLPVRRMRLPGSSCSGHRTSLGANADFIVSSRAASVSNDTCM